MSDTAISEESSQKAKRGRPCKYEQAVTAIWRSQFPELKTDRGVLECSLWARAYHAIRKMYDADPTTNCWAEFYGDKPSRSVFHKAILSALGRIEDADMLEWARLIAENKLSTRAAVAMLRRDRLGTADKPDFLKLVSSIKTALNAYRAAHPSTPSAMMVRALRELAECIEDDEAGAAGAGNAGAEVSDG